MKLVIVWEFDIDEADVEQTIRASMDGVILAKPDASHVAIRDVAESVLTALTLPPNDGSKDTP